MSEKVTFQELIESIAEETDNTKQFTHNFLKDFVDVINSGLESDGNVNIAGLGKFELQHVDEREGYNPQTEERMTIPAHNRIVFKPYKDLRELVNAPYAHLEPELIKEEFESSKKGEPEEKSASDEKDFIPTAPPTSHQAEENVESDQDSDQQEEPPFDIDEPETKTSSSFSFEEEDFENAEEDIVEFSNETVDDDDVNDELREFLGAEETEAASETTEEESEVPEPVTEETIDETSSEEPEQSSPLFPVEEDYEDKEDTATPITPSFDNRRQSRKDSSSVPIIAAAVIVLLLVAGGGWYLGLFSGDDAGEPISNQAVSTAPGPSATDNQGDQNNNEQTQTTEDNQENENESQAQQATQQSQAGQSQQADQQQQNDRESLELTISKGQTLWSIADEQYRNSQLWPWIYDRNGSLNNPNIIHAGNTLTIPLPSGSSQYGLSASDSVAVAQGYITTYRWYKDNGSSEAKNYLWVAKKYHEDLSDIAEVQIDKADLAFANDAR